MILGLERATQVDAEGSTVRFEGLDSSVATLKCTDDGKSNYVGSYGWSKRAKEQKATEQMSNRAKSDGATEGQSDGAKIDGAISLYIKIENRKKKKSNFVGSYG